MSVKQTILDARALERNTRNDLDAAAETMVEILDERRLRLVSGHELRALKRRLHNFDAAKRRWRG